MGRKLFDFPKPTGLIKRMLRIVTDANSEDTVLDFFAGSGTTAHAVMAQNAEDGGNRKWICVQLPEETAEDSEAQKAGYKTIADIARERIRRAGDKIQAELVQKKVPSRGLKEAAGYNDREVKEVEGDVASDLDIGFKSFALETSNYRQWRVLTKNDDVETLKKQAKLFVEKPLIDKYDEESVVYEVLLKEGFDLNAEVVKVKKGSLTIWTVTAGDRKMLITLAPKLTRELVDSLDLAKDDLFVCFDSALDDSLKVNLMKHILLKVI